MTRSTVAPIALACACIVASHGVSAHAMVRARSFLGNGMQPEVVARTLVAVEQEWKAQAAVFVECSSSGSEGDGIVNCADAPQSFAKSCSKVVNAIIQGSSGERDTTKEYMNDVCEQPSLTDWRKEGCTNLASALNEAMSSDSYQNRMNFDSSNLCKNFWSGLLDEEKKRAAEEKAEREEEERKAAEEAAAEKKAAEEAKAAEEVQRKKEAALKAAKEAKAAKEREAAEEAAKAKAAERAKKLAEKKAEVEAEAAAAKAEEEAAKADQKSTEKPDKKVEVQASDKVEDKVDKKMEAKADKKAVTPKSTPADAAKTDAKVAPTLAKKPAEKKV